ncbi:probable protein phosphatase CG10417 isoform X1 [Euwallacea similis]|uniref:probable protein phosphatase CG10417 isoform X1 n=1 Tax=Euwallacea similis TaxID=1736056 RepID=UPI00344B5AAD
MGSYLSEPVTEKISTDESNDKLTYGASSMQGWRVSQEDAHNTILDFEENTSFFAVYDGHGGHEVAQYCSQKLPQYIRETEAYKKGDIEQALIDGFLGFDATIATPEVVSILKEIASEKEAEESDEEENYHNLYEEASMPIEKVIEKYTNLVNPTLNSLKKGEKLPKSPMIAAKKDSSVASASSSTADTDSNLIASPQGSSSSNNHCEAEAGCSGSSKSEPDSSSATNGDINKGSKKEAEDVKNTSDVTPTSNGPIPNIEVSSPEDMQASEADTNTPSDKMEVSESKEQVDEEVKEEAPKDGVKSSVNGDIVSIKGKGKSPMKKPLLKTPEKSGRPTRNAAQLYKKLLDFKPDSDEEEDTEDEEDKTFVEPEVNSDEDEEEADGSGNSSDGDDEDDGEEEEEELDEDGQHELEFSRTIKEEPGSDSGCTAVVAILKGRDLYVANAGDSRCVVCRNGQAVEMSFDHKPEDAPERARIVNAGGKVTADGRVNGGLNLSRAIGDHAYKENKDLSEREQMITALPDIKKLEINPGEDEFMVLACDGIWNYMSNQEVVDFVKSRIEESSDKVSHICEEMFDHCLAPNTMGDGTGCDNMTVIIVKFKSTLKKRLMSPEPSNSEDTEAKRAKTEEPQSIDTSS